MSSLSWTASFSTSVIINCLFHSSYCATEKRASFARVTTLLPISSRSFSRAWRFRSTSRWLWSCTSLSRSIRCFVSWSLTSWAKSRYASTTALTMSAASWADGADIVTWIWFVLRMVWTRSTWRISASASSALPSLGYRISSGCLASALLRTTGLVTRVTWLSRYCPKSARPTFLAKRACSPGSIRNCATAS